MGFIVNKYPALVSSLFRNTQIRCSETCRFIRLVNRLTVCRISVDKKLESIGCGARVDPAEFDKANDFKK